MTGMAGILLLSESPADGRASFAATSSSILGGGAGTSENLFAMPPVTDAEKDRWNMIVIHHSGRMAGTVPEMDARAKRAGLNGLAYHFVIGNGAGLSDGVVEIGYRWTQQTPGAHVAAPPNPTSEERAFRDELNSQSIGICLIGNGDRQLFTEAQIRELIDLVRTLQRTWDIPASSVLLHSDIVDVSNPGRFFPAERLEAHIDS